MQQRTSMPYAGHALLGRGDWWGVDERDTPGDTPGSGERYAAPVEEYPVRLGLR